MQIKTLKPGLQEIDLDDLKIEAKTTHIEIQKKQKELNKMVENIDKGPIQLPKKTLQRYEKNFGKTVEKNAFKLVFAAFIIAFIFSFFMQPSIIFSNNKDEIMLVNLAGRNVKNIEVYDFGELANVLSQNAKTPVTTKLSLAPGEALSVPTTKTTIFIAFAERQLPAVGTIYKYSPGKANTNINNSKNDINSGLYSGLHNQTTGGN
jgi:hypothetical protein